MKESKTLCCNDITKITHHLSCDNITLVITSNKDTFDFFSSILLEKEIEIILLGSNNISSSNFGNDILSYNMENITNEEQNKKMEELNKKITSQSNSINWYKNREKDFMDKVNAQDKSIKWYKNREKDLINKVALRNDIIEDFNNRKVIKIIRKFKRLQNGN